MLKIYIKVYYVYVCCLCVCIIYIYNKFKDVKIAIIVYRVQPS